MHVYSALMTYIGKIRKRHVIICVNQWYVVSKMLDNVYLLTYLLIKIAV